MNKHARVNNFCFAQFCRLQMNSHDLAISLTLTWLLFTDPIYIKECKVVTLTEQ